MFIQQDCFKMTKSNSKDFYIVTKKPVHSYKSPEEEEKKLSTKILSVTVWW